jgi:hypothetical protein
MPEYGPVLPILNVPEGISTVSTGVAIENGIILLCTELTVTYNDPDETPAGTSQTILVFAQEVYLDASTVLKVTVLVPLVAPKLLPLIVMDWPEAKLEGLIVVILGATTIV